MGAVRQPLTRAAPHQSRKEISLVRSELSGRESDPLSPDAIPIPSPIALQRDSETWWTGGPMLAVSPSCPPNTHLKTPKGISCKLEFLMWKEMCPDIFLKNHNKCQHHTKEKKILRSETLKEY